MVTPDLLKLLEEDKLCTLAGSKYILIETPMGFKIPRFIELIKSVIEKGYIPVIAHPERYSYVQKNIEEAKKMVEAGAYLQIDTESLVGMHGSTAKDAGIKLLKLDLIHFIGSDVHSVKSVFDFKDKPFEIIKKIVGEEKLRDIVFNNPMKIINNAEIA